MNCKGFMIIFFSLSRYKWGLYEADSMEDDSISWRRMCFWNRCSCRSEWHDIILRLVFKWWQPYTGSITIWHCVRNAYCFELIEEQDYSISNPTQKADCSWGFGKAWLLMVWLLSYSSPKVPIFLWIWHFLSADATIYQDFQTYSLPYLRCTVFIGMWTNYFNIAIHSFFR